MRAFTLLLDAMTPLLKRHGFSKMKDSWYRKGKEVVHVLNVQKSDFSQRFYINVGVYLVKFGEADRPRFNHCHAYGRLDHLVDTPDELERALDFEPESESVDDKLATILHFLGQYGVPFLDNLQTAVDVYNSYQRGQFSHFLVTRQLRDAAIGSDMRGR